MGQRLSTRNDDAEQPIGTNPIGTSPRAKTRRRRPLTAAVIKTLPAGREHRDPSCPGLYIYVWPSGKRTWILRFRRPGSGRHAKLTLGTFTDIEPEALPAIGGFLTPAGARQIANDCWRTIKLGRDPAVARKAEKHETAASRAKTFEWAAREFVVRYAKPKNRRWREAARMLGFIIDKDTGEVSDKLRDKSLVKRWRDQSVSMIRKRDIVVELDRLMDQGSPYAAIALLSLLRKMFSWLVARDVISFSPCAGIAKPHTPESRDRVLTDVELRAFWSATATMGYPFRPMFRLLLITGQRRDECRAIRGNEISLIIPDNTPGSTPHGAVWQIPGIRTKNQRDHSVWLSPLALQAIGLIKPDYLFTTTGKLPASGVSKAKQRCDTLMLKALRKRDKKAELADWRLHDLRRTVATRMIGLGVLPHVVEAVLNHVGGSRAGVAGVYNRHPYADEIRDALTRWEAELLRIVDGEREADPLSSGEYGMAVAPGQPSKIVRRRWRLTVDTD